MNDYRLSLALSYFRERGEEYEISEMMELLGLTRDRLSELLESLLDEKLIEYSDNLLHITKKGLTRLIAQNQGDMIINQDTIEFLYIKPDNAQSFEHPYIPLKFFRKYSG